MEYHAPVSWVPAGLFALLAVFFLQKAFRSKARRTWGWGRTGGQVPISRAGYAVWGITCSIVALILVYGESRQLPLALALLLPACILAIVGAGARDTWRHRRNRSKRQDGKQDDES